jgi:hypothetical protein
MRGERGRVDQKYSVMNLTRSETVATFTFAERTGAKPFPS